MSEAPVTPEAAKPPKPHRSPSAMGTYFRCGEKFRREYIELEKQPPNLAMLKGTGMHRAAQHNFEQKLTSHVDLPYRDVVDAGVAAFDQELTKGITLDDKDKALGKEVAIGLARDDVAKFATAFTIAQAPHYQPVEGGIERRYRIPVEKATHDLLGVIDLVAIVDNKPGNRIRDFKTSKKKKTATDAAGSDQLTAYAAGHLIEFGFPAVDVGLDNLVIKAKGVERQELVETRDQGDFMALSNKLNAMDAGIKAGVFLPADPGNWICKPSMCQFFPTCPYVNAERVLRAKAAEAEEE